MTTLPIEDAKTRPENAPPLDSEGSDSRQVTWNPGDPTDGKKKYQFDSGYPFTCRIEIFLEAIYLVGLMVLAAYFIVWYVAGTLPLVTLGVRGDELPKALHKLIAFPIAGLMGGTMFGLKWQYRVAARGWWHKDRRVWRLCSPWLSAALAMMIGIVIDGGLLGLSFSRDAADPTSTLISIGFVTGYFADSALAKLQDIASVVFSTKAESPK
ncbi:MAG: hypothetical protein IV101_21295 [Dechloromonas sp.]|nr:hypothetical protein [Dechloromonas sp.]